MNICILGSGIQGRVVAQDLAESNHQVTVIDNNQNNLKKNVESLRITTKLFDVTNKEKLIKFIEEFDIVVGALPSNLGFYLMKCAIKAGVDLVDLSYAAENPFLLDKQAKKNKVRIVPDAGFAPGLSNILIGEAHRELGKIDNLRILVGGIPQNPHPPFNYKYTWSPSDLIAEYTRPARIVKHHKFLTVEALSGIENFSIPKIGTLECFYTDGLRTLMHTFKDIKNMEEKTIRYAGHAELMKELLKYGFLPNEDNPFTNDQIKPKDFILDFLNKEL
ncbi:MAG: saccharopine dehydrogenase C-terminal domain-containing protein, partial [candidate division WOR-3 bacterium]